jgi:hypothetical protein
VSNTLTAGTTPGGYNYGFGLTNVGGVNYLDLIVSSLSTAYTFSVPNGNWGDYSSWNPTTGMPGAQDTATFNMGGNPTVMLNGTQTVQGVALSGSGSLMANDGPGTLTVTSAVTVGSGQTLHGSGHITAPTFNLNGGTLGGPLNLTGNVTSTGGQLTPGDAAVINIAGNLSLDHTSAVNLQLGAPAGPNDQIAVTGNIALDGTLNVTALTGFGAGSYTLLAATGTAGGTFANVTGIPAPAVDSRGFYIVYTGAVSIVSGNQVVLNVTLGGDTNRDGVLNSLDIDAIYQNMTVAPTSYQGTWPRALAAYQAQYDLNGDSVVNQDDVSYELQHYFLTNFGDGDMNHATDFQDFQILLNHWQATGPSVGWATADFNGDGVVDFLDFQMLLNYWNPGGWNISPSQVPEPASLTLILLGALGLVRRRSSR